MEDLRIEIKLDEGATMPKAVDDFAVGYDLYVLEDSIIQHGRNLVGTGVHVSLPKGIGIIIKPRSGFSVNGIEGEEASDPNFVSFADALTHGNADEWKPSFDSGVIRRFNADVLDGVIDPGYHNAIGVIVNNFDVPFKLRKGTRIAQAIFIRYERPYLDGVDKLTGYNRGGGFGHSGTK